MGGLQVISGATWRLWASSARLSLKWTSWNTGKPPGRTGMMSDKPKAPSYEAFCAALGSLSGPQEPPGGEAASTPQEAALRASYAVCFTHRGQKGVVLVMAPDQVAARDCRAWLDRYFSEEPALNRELLSMTTVGV